MNKEWKSEYDEKLIIAQKARKNAYCPYSHFSVGAALKTKEGRIFSGCNIENAMFGASICAERSALFSAISAGFKDFSSILIVGNNDKISESVICPPCGFCRQTLIEFVDKNDFLFVLVKTDSNGKVEKHKIFTMEELYPQSFGNTYLQC